MSEYTNLYLSSDLFSLVNYISNSVNITSSDEDKETAKVVKNELFVIFLLYL